MKTQTLGSVLCSIFLASLRAQIFFIQTEPNRAKPTSLLERRALLCEFIPSESKAGEPKSSHGRGRENQGERRFLQRNPLLLCRF
jgi:hypothetical protein